MTIWDKLKAAAGRSISFNIRRKAEMRIAKISLCLTLCSTLAMPIVARADNAAAATKTAAEPQPTCSDPVPPSFVAANPKVAVEIDPKTAWRPPGGTVAFTIKGNGVSLDGVKVDVCFGWNKQNFHRSPLVWLTDFKTNEATYNAVVPDDPTPADLPWANRTLLGIIPNADMRILVAGGAASPTIDLIRPVGITSPVVALLLAVAAAVIALAMFFVLGRARGVPGKGLLLWLISTKSGYASLSQLQIMLWTFVVGISAVYVMSLSGGLIDITNGVLVLLGISGAATVGSKLQSSQEDAKSSPPSTDRPAIPGTVTNLVQVGDASETEVRLAWGEPSTGGATTSYSVQYRVNPAGGAAPAEWSAVTESVVRPHHTVLGLSPNTDYQFRICAMNAGGSGDPAQIGPIHTRPLLAPPAGAPGEVAGFHTDRTPSISGVSLSWQAAANTPTGYAVQYRVHDSIDPWTDAGSGNRTTFTATRLEAGTTYDFRVQATNANGRGPWSAVVIARTLRNPEWADLVVTGDGRGEIDVTRAQMLFFTVVTATFVGLKVLTSYIIPDIPSGFLLLMGISNGVYMTAKYIPG
jgi:hypothetical protein